MSVSFEERRDLSHVLGIVVRPADVAALTPGRGPGFDRLARLGAALLDVLLTRFEASGGTRPQQPDVARLLPLLEAEPDAADLLHASVAAAYRGQAWSGVRAVVSRLLSEQAGPVPKLPAAFSPEQAVDAGRTVLTAAGLLLRLARDPSDDLAARPLDADDAALADVGRVLVVRGEKPAVDLALPLLR